MHLESGQILDDLKDVLLKGPEGQVPPITGLSIDSRTLEPGDMFIALTTDTDDGHRWVEDAFSKGATAALVSYHDAGKQGPCFVVTDVEHALVTLAKGTRHRSNATCVGVTGSVGKTGTKEALHHVLSAFGPTHRNIGSYNNQWGVPLSLSCMPSDAHWGVFEMGMNHPNEIRPLTQLVRPHVALITCIAGAHLAFFKSLEDIAHAKAEIFEGLIPGGTAVLNQDDPFFPLLSQKARALGARIVSFGRASEADVRLEHMSLLPESSEITVCVGGVSLTGTIAHPGIHWTSNALGVLAACHALDLPLEVCLARLATLPPLTGRGERFTRPWKGGSVTILDETYNANPASMKAALDLLAQQQAYSRRIAVVGDMLELGEESLREHQALGDVLNRPEFDRVLTCGPLMQALDSRLLPQKHGGWAPDVQALWPLLEQEIQPGDSLMIKGSNSIQLSRIIELFKKM